MNMRCLTADTPNNPNWKKNMFSSKPPIFKITFSRISHLNHPFWSSSVCPSGRKVQVNAAGAELRTAPWSPEEMEGSGALERCSRHVDVVEKWWVDENYHVSHVSYSEVGWGLHMFLTQKLQKNDKQRACLRGTCLATPNLQFDLW